MSSFSNSDKSGFIMKSPLILPTLTAATGPSNGISEIISAADMPVIPKTSDTFSSPYERTETIP